MPKQPSRPGIPIPPADEPGSGRHRACNVGRAAIARTEQLAQRLDDHIDEDDDRLAGLTRDVEVVHHKVDTVSDHVGDLRVDVARVSTVVDSIRSTLDEQNEIKRVRVVAEVNADVETRKTAQIVAIEDDADRRKARRALLLKVAYGLVVAAGTIIGALIEHIIGAFR